jgi:hypothetical protein
MSERRMNSYLTSVLIWPTAVRKRRAVIHSCEERRVSRAKSWKWVTSFSSKNLRRGFGVCDLIAWTFSGYVLYREILEARWGVRGSCWCGHWWELQRFFYGEELLCFSSSTVGIKRDLGSRLCRREFGVYVYARNLSFRETELTCLSWFNMAVCCRRSR